VKLTKSAGYSRCYECGQEALTSKFLEVGDVIASDDINIENPATNNGGSTDYYKIDKKWNMAQDIIEAREMNYAQGNVLKAAFTFNTKRHDGTDYERELNKIIYFAKRELVRIKR